MGEQKVSYWCPRGILGLILLGLFTFSAWVGYQRGHAVGWIRGHNDGVAFSKKAGVLSDETGTGVVAFEKLSKDESEPSLTVTAVRREVTGSDGQPVCTVNTTKRRANGRLIEASSEAIAGPC